MDILQALILGIIQGITEFLPVSSDGHLTLATALLGARGEDNLLFNVIVHTGTTLSAIIVFRKDIYLILRGLLKFKWNDETRYAALILLSMVPVGIVGLFFKDQVKAAFISDYSVAIAGAGLIGTGILLLGTLVIRQKHREIGFGSAFLIGIAQALAVLPGLSRSGSTISTGLMMGIDREKMAKFSFLMVIPPILGEALLDLKDVLEEPTKYSIGAAPLFAGFVAAFLVGLAACSAMISLVKKGKIHWFGVYCIALGAVALILGLR